MTIAEKLTYVYENLEPWHVERLSHEEANNYHERLLMQGNIITVVEDEQLVAYMEVWRINQEQLGRIFCGEKVYALDEDILTGNVAYVNNAWVKDKSIDTKIYKLFVEKFGQCKYLARKRYKYNDSFKVYPMRSLVCQAKKRK